MLLDRVGGNLPLCRQIWQTFVETMREDMRVLEETVGGGRPGANPGGGAKGQGGRGGERRRGQGTQRRLQGPQPEPVRRTRLPRQPLRQRHRPGGEGDGRSMGWKVGADFRDTPYVKGTVGIYPGDDPREGGTGILAVYKGAIAVDFRGRRFVDESLPYKEIGDALSISPLTVKRHAGNIYDKLGAGSRREAVSIALELGWKPERGRP